MANSMAYISFLLSSIFLLSSHVLTQELFKENPMINVDWYDLSGTRFKMRPTLGLRRSLPPNSHYFRSWSERVNIWPDRFFGSPKNKHNSASSPPYPPPTNMDHYTHSLAFHYNDGFISGKKSHVIRNRTGRFHHPRPWADHSNPWPSHASKKLALQPGPKKNKRRPPPPTN
ncbi:uncharacterized protein LOC130941996 isoform X1 [Arachis stenosperma]|uniref:uncharacterized protein LOC130941996 isoform X1 n=1 Tax=Arachis stenosperma TaxID=217475 RepID=UPI0025AC004B|nr:uncharacterized protein LOC130941996 isoform X1 [Arachis stenosperma]